MRYMAVITLPASHFVGTAVPETAAPPYNALSEARRLLRCVRAATLATLQPGSGFPLATLTAIATDFDGTPILLMSQLSTHTRHLQADGRCSLLLAQGGKGDPLAHPRLSLVGTAVKITEPSHRQQLRVRFLNRNPKAALYADFGDFSFWRVELQQAHLNGGFGKAAEFAGGALVCPVPEGLAEAEAGLVDRLNTAGTATLKARVIAGGGAAQSWRASGADALGIDLAAGEALFRLDFDDACADMAAMGRQMALICR